MQNPSILLTPAEIQRSPLAFDKHTVATLRNEPALRRRDDLLAESTNIECVRGEKSQAVALDLLKRIGDMLSAAEKSRKEVKAPFIAIGKVIEAVAADHNTPLETEKARLKQLLADYQKELDRIAAEERAKYEAEQRRIAEAQVRIQREAEAQQRAIEEAARKAEIEAQRKEQEAANATSLQARLLAEEAAAQARQAAEAQALAAQQAQQAADLQVAQLAVQAAEAMPLPASVSPASVRRTRVFKVLDMEAFYHAYPRLVKMEPRTAELNNLIREKSEDGSYKVVSVPGLELTEETDVRAK